MKTIDCICDHCGKSYARSQSEFTRALSNNKPMYCSRTCSAKAKGSSNFGGKPNRVPPTVRQKTNPFKYYYRNCKRRGFEFDLDLNYLETLWNLQEGKCAYTGIKLVLNTHSIQHEDYRYSASLDRIDSSKGYIKGNVQYVSTAINLMKNTLTHNQTVEFLQEIAKSITT